MAAHEAVPAALVLAGLAACLVDLFLAKRVVHVPMAARIVQMRVAALRICLAAFWAVVHVAVVVLLAVRRVVWAVCLNNLVVLAALRVLAGLVVCWAALQARPKAAAAAVACLMELMKRCNDAPHVRMQILDPF